MDAESAAVATLVAEFINVDDLASLRDLHPLEPAGAERSAALLEVRDLDREGEGGVAVIGPVRADLDALSAYRGALEAAPGLRDGEDKEGSVIDRLPF